MRQALVGATIADVYTGTWVAANVEFEDGVITYVGPREPACTAIDVAGKVLVPGYIEPHTHPWCLYSPTSLLEVAVPDGTTTLVYDNLFFFLSHGVDGLRTIVDAGAQVTCWITGLCGYGAATGALVLLTPRDP